MSALLVLGQYLISIWILLCFGLLGWKDLDSFLSQHVRVADWIHHMLITFSYILFIMYSIKYQQN